MDSLYQDDFHGLVEERMNVCIVSVGARERYLPYIDRLEASLRKFAPNIPRLFFRDCYPPESPTHNENHYYFKAFSVRAAYQAGFEIVIWLDAACEVLADLSPIIAKIVETGYYIVAGDEPLGEWVSDQALARFHVTRDEAMQLRLCGGAIVGLDFRKVGAPFLREWFELGAAGLFYTSHSVLAPDKMSSLRMSDGPGNVVHSKDPRCKGHRADEACFSLMLERRGLDPFDVNDYFCHLEHPNPKAILKTGYDGVWELVR